MDIFRHKTVFTDHSKMFDFFLSAGVKFLLKVPSVKLVSYGHQCFVFVVPSLWNSLPNNVRESGLLSDFKTCIKTYMYLFNKFYN